MADTTATVTDITSTKPKATAKAKQTVSSEVQRVRSATAAANRAPIDFTVSKTNDDLAAEAAVERSRWVARLEDLYEGVENGPGEFDVLYKIGTFKTTTGARTVFNSIAKRVLPREYLLETRLVGFGTARHSELWAGVPSDDGADAE